MAIIKSVSLNKEQVDFLTENKDIKLSFLVQQTLNNIMERTRTKEQEIALLRNKNQKLSELLEKATKFIEQKGLWGVFENGE